MFFVENSAENGCLSHLRIGRVESILTRLSLSDNDPTTFEDLFKFVHLQIPVGISGLCAGGDQNFLHGELDHEGLRMIDSVFPGEERE